MKNTPIAIIQGKDFAEAFRIVATGVDPKANRPINAHVLIVANAEDKTVTLRAARIGFSFKYVLSTQDVRVSDMFTLSPTEMNKRSGVLQGPVTLERTTMSTIKFGVGNMSFVMESLDPDDFMSDRSLDMQPVARFSGEELARYLRLVMATVDSRMHLAIGGVWLRSAKDKLLLASAAEARGGTRCEVPVQIEADTPLDMIIPKPMVEAMLIGLAFADKGQYIELLRDSKGDLLGIQVGNTTIMGQLTNSVFPDIDAMLTQVIGTWCDVPRQEIAAALNMIALSWDRKDIPTRVTLHFREDGLHLYNPVRPDNQAFFGIAIGGTTGHKIEVNTKQVYATVVDLRAQTVRFAITAGALKYVFITDPSDPKYLHVAFPFNETYAREVVQESDAEDIPEEDFGHYQEAA